MTISLAERSNSRHFIECILKYNFTFLRNSITDMYEYLNCGERLTFEHITDVFPGVNFLMRVGYISGRDTDIAITYSYTDFKFSTERAIEFLEEGELGY